MNQPMPGSPHPESQTQPAPCATPRPSIGVYFNCANAYLRIHRNNQGTHYLARCPKCAKTIRFRVDSEGTSQRFFEVSC